ncbi:MAG: glycosyltransferase family 25 protein [Acidocella sp.]|nr:glycosyltransferase family 25 protein [Acidocella sp.]
MRRKPSVTSFVRTISMAGDPRRATFVPPQAELGLDWAFMDASTDLLEGLRFDPDISRRHAKRLLTKSELGCYSSHVHAWRMLLAHPSASQMIVLEDDVMVDWPLLGKIAAYDWAGSNVHYLKLHARGYPPARHLTTRHPEFIYEHSPFYPHGLVHFTGLALGTQAYLITRKAAASFEAQARLVSRPIDRQMDRAWGTGIPVIGFVPFPAIEQSGPSTIGYAGMDKVTLTLPQRARYYIARATELLRIRLYHHFAASPRLSRP